MGQSAQHKLDLRGAIIPFTLLKIIQAFKAIDPGEILEVFWNDPNTQADLFKILPESTYDLIITEVIKEEKPFYRMEIKKRPAETTL